MKTWPFYLAGIWVAIMFGAAATSIVIRSCSPSRPVAHSSARDSIRAYNAVSRALDSVDLVEYGRKVEAARGDSLAGLLSDQAMRIRTRWLPGRLDTIIRRDTVRDSILVAGRDVRAVMLSDSACTVRAGSLAGVVLLDSLEIAELRRRPESCSGWSSFVAGSAAGCAVCGGAVATFCLAK